MYNTNCQFVKKLGVLSLLDEESRFPKGTDQTLLEKLHKAHEVHITIQYALMYIKYGYSHYIIIKQIIIIVYIKHNWYCLQMNQLRIVIEETS